MAAAYPTRSVASVSAAAGNLHRFINRIEVGDLVVTPDGEDIYVGVITSQVRHDPDSEEAHRRSTRWVHPHEPLERGELSDAARSKLRTMLTVADLSTLAEEFARRSGLAEG